MRGNGGVEMPAAVDAPPKQSDSRPPLAARRAGYAVMAAIGAVGLYVAHRLVDWGWPRFLTAEFEDVLPVVTVSLVVSILVNLIYCLDDSPPVRSLGELIDAVTGLVAAVRIYQVFPFDFSTYASDWSWLVRLVLIVVIVGCLIGAAVHLGKLLRRASIGAPDPISTDDAR